MTTEGKAAPGIQGDGMGQDGPKGAPDPAALEAVRKANEAPEYETVAEAAPAPAAAPVPTTQLPADPVEAMLKLLDDPRVATKMVERAASTPEGRAMLNLRPGQGPPSGEYRRDYENEPQLRVYGGVEVSHPPEADGTPFTPLPPSYIKPWLRADGTKTDHKDPKYEVRKKSVPVMDPGSGKQAFNEDGNPIYEEQPVEVLVDPGAARDERGRPIKTDEYKLFLDKLMVGQRLDPQVQTDIAAGKFGTAVDGGTTAPRVEVDGNPAVVGPAIGQVEPAAAG